MRRGLLRGTPDSSPLSFFSSASIWVPTADWWGVPGQHTPLVAIYDAGVICLPPVSRRAKHGGKIGRNGAVEHKVDRKATVTGIGHHWIPVRLKRLGGELTTDDHQCFNSFDD